MFNGKFFWQNVNQIYDETMSSEDFKVGIYFFHKIIYFFFSNNFEIYYAIPHCEMFDA